MLERIPIARDGALRKCILEEFVHSISFYVLRYNASKVAGERKLVADWVEPGNGIELRRLLVIN